MMENLVKPIVESLEVLRGSLQSSQADAVMDTDITSGPQLWKNMTIQAIDEYMDRERRKFNIVIHKKLLFRIMKRLVYYLSLSLKYVYVMWQGLVGHLVAKQGCYL